MRIGEAQPTWLRGVWGTIVFPVVMTLLVASLRWLLGDVFEAHDHLVLCYLVVAASAVLASWQAGLLAALLGAVAGYFLFLWPDSSKANADAFHEFFIFACVASAVVLIVHWARRQRLAGQHRAEVVLEALRASEARLRAIFNHAGVGIVEADAEQRIVDANERVCEILGYSRSELIGKTIREITAPEDQAETNEMISRVRCGNVLRCELEKRYIRGDGSLVWGDVTICKLHDRRASQVRTIATIADLTERKRAEQGLRDAMAAAEENRAQLETLIQAASDGIMVTDPNGQVVLANRAQAAIQGFNSVDELLRARSEQSGFELLTADGVSLPREEWPLARLVNGASISGLELRYRRTASTNEKWLSFGGEPIRDGNGRTTAGILVTRDITEARRVERQIRESREELNEAQAVSGTGSWRLDVEPDRLRWSDETYRMFGVAIGTQLTYDAFLRCVHPEDRAMVDQSWQQALRTGYYNIEHRIVVGDRVKWVNERARLEFSRDGRLRAGFGTVQDITERKAIENALDAARSAAEEANRQKDHFLAVLSHELRTPLMPVLTAVSMLRESATDGAVRETLGMVQRNVELEARLIDDLLDVTRIARGKMTLELRPCELGGVLRDVVDVCRSDLEARGLQFHLDGSHGAYPSWTMGDAARLQQVFWNLLRNAVKFTPHGGSVTITCVRHGSTLVVEVKDTGIGIEPQALKRIFNAFEQESVGTNPRFGGLGLGLAITKALVELHGGTIEAYSEGKDKGASFVVQLPVCPAPAASVRPPSSRQRKSAAMLSILLVEDHGDTARVLRKLLEAQGHHVQAAGDVAGAMEVVALGELDLLISDLGLPDGSGVDLMAKVKSIAPALPAIALSGYGQEEDISNALQAGFREHLVKPVSPERLLECIARVVPQPAAASARHTSSPTAV